MGDWIMNLNRLKSNLVNRDWSSKNTKTNISYIKGKLKQFGLTTPKYLDNGKLTSKQIQAQTKRIVNAINREKDILRKEANKTTFETYRNKLQKTAEKHNNLVYKKLGYLVNKYNMSENQLNYMIGMDVNINGYKHDDKYTFSRTNSQFQIIDLENFYANDIEGIRQRIKQINKLNERLTNRNIDKEVKKSPQAKAQIEQILREYTQDGYMSSAEAENIMTRFNNMNGIQQEIFYKMVVSSYTKEKYIISDDEMESFQLNLKNKWNTLINKASEF